MQSRPLSTPSTGLLAGDSCFPSNTVTNQHQQQHCYLTTSAATLLLINISSNTATNQHQQQHCYQSTSAATLLLINISSNTATNQH
jgi:hypothetical protein